MMTRRTAYAPNALADTLIRGPLLHPYWRGTRATHEAQIPTAQGWPRRGPIRELARFSWTGGRQSFGHLEMRASMRRGSSLIVTHGQDTALRYPRDWAHRLEKRAGPSAPPSLPFFLHLLVGSSAALNDLHVATTLIQSCSSQPLLHDRYYYVCYSNACSASPRPTDSRVTARPPQPPFHAETRTLAKHGLRRLQRCGECLLQIPTGAPLVPVTFSPSVSPPPTSSRCLICHHPRDVYRPRAERNLTDHQACEAQAPTVVQRQRPHGMPSQELRYAEG